jgi:hypothetical protein
MNYVNTFNVKTHKQLATKTDLIKDALNFEAAVTKL